MKAKKGDTVAAGDVVLVIDSMKVFHWIAAPLAGRMIAARCGSVSAWLRKYTVKPFLRPA